MESQLTETQLQEFKDLFDVFDEDSSGHISRNELSSMLRATGLSPTMRELTAMVEEVDEDGNGTITFPEFLALMYRHHFKAAKDDTAELTAAFNMLDKNNSGSVSLKEFRQVLTVRGDRMTNREVDEVLRLADRNDDGRISLTEFLALMRLA
mmetsp:Transcript_114098/g.355311  ORF Transcript_114098/g.355311 Transcript_114098/m.355311 type:complete len:152 (-) Transcript_114098:261-716(-)|eukprot:CAMPEP_0204589332 /NCGR_PEP_ID=MMETSP0661-20131031/49140_1 /ASSEMBLY_ACC=CAM_ASM_000606 /TAXON_ID=109239 /ORGANISM="Alexandrium margalefi, Strain AMGDE01CS-322" /LENGTH=151 /DNA_ID=CAMNT_0051599251 /DNA_START=120 /DNA_END=575 /DNA_ORIENTATION=-